MNTPTPLSSAPGNPHVNLALQGGGSHGAFTWGVLDTLLDDGRVAFEGISGTSAGAMNAVAMAHGLAQAQGRTQLQMRESARASLQQFWDGIVDMGAVANSISQAQRAPFDILFGGFGRRFFGGQPVIPLHGAENLRIGHLFKIAMTGGQIAGTGGADFGDAKRAEPAVERHRSGGGDRIKQFGGIFLAKCPRGIVGS
jgi:hypothetical protein